MGSLAAAPSLYLPQYVSNWGQLPLYISINLVIDMKQEVKNLLHRSSTILVFQRKLAISSVINTVRGQALFRSYGRLFAEFLNEESLVHLGLLDLSTCVGLRYG